MKKAIIQALVAIIILIIGILIFLFLIKTKPEAEKVAITVEPPTVKVIIAKKSNEPLSIHSQGEVIPPKRTTLSAQAMGKVLSVSPKYEVGEQFNEGEIIMTIEDIDYRTALINAKATKAQAEANLKEAEVNLQLEQAKVSQAKRDWDKLGKGRTASPLLLRKPQIQSAEAKIDAATIAIEQAQANIEQAQRDLDRTKIRAPYICQIEQKQIDLGALVTVGTPLVTVYEKGRVEARLPISLEDLPFLKYSQGQDIASVKAFAQYGNERKEWSGQLIRSENQIDSSSRSAYVITGFEGEDPPPVGLFIDVELEGIPMEGVTAIPRVALNRQEQVIIVEEDDTISFRDVQVRRSSNNMVFLSSGVEEGERICTTVMNTPIEGIKVKVASKETEQ